MKGLIEKIKITNMMIPGATPNVTISARESNCFPSSPILFSFLAKKPSKKSNIAPRKIKYGAISILPIKEDSIAKTPHIKFEAVNKFGR